MKFILFTILLFAPIIVKADEPRHRNVFTSPNGKYELVFVSKNYFQNPKWSLIEKATKRVLYQVIDEPFYSMTVLVSDDGKTLVAIDDWSERNIDKDKNFAVLSFYSSGNLIKKYTLEELLNSKDNIQSSVSHFSWFFERGELPIVDSKISLTTYDLIHYTFDVNTGEILKKELDNALAENAIYVYGDVKELKNRRYEIEVCHAVQGVIPTSGKIEFEIEQGAKLYTGYQSLIIRNGKLVTKKSVMLNSCNYQRDKRLK